MKQRERERVIRSEDDTVECGGDGHEEMESTLIRWFALKN